jgi:hypothetical protein
MKKTGEIIEPDAGALSESLRDFGYTLPQAIADLIDNSLTVEATEIFITVHEEDQHSFIAVIDNGKGMSCEELVEAMRMGTLGPLAIRSNNDLGRFGLGMKTASLSMGRSLTVISRQEKNSKTVIRRWDMEHIALNGWQLLTEASPYALNAIGHLHDWPSGTAVIIEKLDRVSFNKPRGYGIEKNLALTLKSLSSHLSMVFHRFISSGVKIHVGPSSLKGWDPFMIEKSTRLPQENFSFAGTSISVIPYILPHHSRITEDEHSYAAGPNGWNEHQGFYIYRNNRLVLPGTWLNLGIKKEEHYKLARIQVDLPNSVDAEWQLNVMKSHVAVPPALRPDFMRIASDVRQQASEVYRYRGERQVPDRTPPERFIWKRQNTPKGVQFKIDQTHPLVQSMLNSGCGHDKLLRQVLEIIERFLPVASIIAEPAKSLDGVPISLTKQQCEDLIALASHTEQFLVRHGLQPQKAREKILLAEPFSQYREQIVSFLESRGKCK